MEVGNALLMPAFMVFICFSLDEALSWWFAFVCIPMCALLIVGGLYWRAKLHQIEGNPAVMRAFLPVADSLQVPLTATTVGAMAVCAWVWIAGGGASTGDRVVITIAALLAVLEYINYYHRQLQHFDHWPDLKRLFEGRGFQRSQMASDLARMRRSAK
jgi:hypothetical protein